MANQNNTNFMDTLLDAQKTAVETVVENTKKLTNGNNLVNDTMNKGGEWYKNWLDNQKNILGQASQKATETAEKTQAGATQMGEFYQNWYNTQMNNAKQMWDMNQSWMQNAQKGATGSTANPFEAATQQWNNWTSQMNNWNNNMNTANNWMGMMNGFQNNNPFNMDAWKTGGQNWNGIFNQWSELLNSSFGEWQNNLQNGTTQDAFRNMLNSAEGITRFYQMWTPMWKSIQEKTFNMEAYKNMMNPGQYKEFMDKFFGFMPESVRSHMQQMTDAFQNQMKQAGNMGVNGYHQARQAFGQMMPTNGNDIFGQLLSGYNQMYSQFQNAVSPIAKMMTPTQHSRTATEWSELANRMMVFNIKNAEMQYMVYTQGTKVMDKLAENTLGKIENGTEINSMMSLYQEWLNISDSTFVELFQSDEYSQIMAEVSAMQLKLRKDMETLTEKMLAPIPVATRSEMDELYKTIYDLKKEVRQLEKMMELGNEEEVTATATATNLNTTTVENENASKNNGAAANNNGRAKKA